MSDTKLGQVIHGDAQRDAIHVAVAPVIAAERLVPGTHIGFVKDGDTEHVGVRCQKTIGVVDPYLVGFVNVGERFWMCLYPQSVTSLRHEWTHPDFSAQEDSPRAASERWLRDCAESIGRSYSALMAAAETCREDNDEYLIGGSEMEGVATPEDFWMHYEVVTGKKVARRYPGFFSCSC